MKFSEGGVTVTMQEDSTLVELDFGRYGSVHVPPEVAMTFVSSQGLRDRIRTECQRAHRERRKLTSTSSVPTAYPANAGK